MVTQPTAQPPADAIGLRRWVVKNIVFTLVLAALLFGMAGRLDYSGGWVYLVVLVAVQGLDYLLLPHSLLAERSKLREGTKKWDLVLSSAMALWGPLLLYLVAALDARYGWTASFTPALTAAGVLVALGGALFTIWAMRANAFFSGTVRIQGYRHQVVSTGPYRLMRHPGYVGATVHYLAAPVVLGSLAAFIPAVLVVILTVTRTALEDRTLQAELPGYAEYAQQIRARLLPGVW